MLNPFRNPSLIIPSPSNPFPLHSGAQSNLANNPPNATSPLATPFLKAAFPVALVTTATVVCPAAPLASASLVTNVRVLLDPLVTVASTHTVTELPSSVAVTPSEPTAPPAVTDDPSRVADAVPEPKVAEAVASGA